MPTSRWPFNAGTDPLISRSTGTKQIADSNDPFADKVQQAALELAKFTQAFYSRGFLFCWWSYDPFWYFWLMLASNVKDQSKSSSGVGTFSFLARNYAMENMLNPDKLPQ